MKIRTKLFLAAIFLFGAIFIIGLIVLISAKQVNSVSQKEIIANTLVQEVFKLEVLTVDYQLHQEERSKKQLEYQYQRINKILQRYSLTDMQKELVSSKEIYTQTITATQLDKDSEFREGLVSQLQIKLQSIVNSATQLSEQAEKERENIKRTTDLLIFIFIIGGNITMIIAIFLLYRSIVIPISNLSAIAGQVQKGDLTVRASISSKDEIGQFSSTLNTMLDALKDSHENLEQKVQKRTKELQTTNKDLEAFSYSVSHDLRAPLRIIDGFSKILEENYSAKFDEQGREAITTIRESTEKMTLLIDELLKLSRIGRKAINLQPIDMTATVKEIFAEQQQQNSNRNITFTCAALPTAMADQVLIRQVWANLLSNAIKYTGKKTNPTISVGSMIHNGEISYYVQDNGAGFDMKDIGKLFGVFQRLHDERDFQGTGIGLANVERIITKHGGRIWAIGEVNKGATFYFSLPHIDSSQKTS